MTLPKRKCACRTNSWVGRYSRYPEGMEERVAEGGRRVRGESRLIVPSLPLVTIVTVCFNSVGTLRQCMESVFNQTYENIEYIVIDGQSTDGTLDLLIEFDGQIDYYISERDSGLYQAMNKGLELASGTHILLLNSDDWYDPDCVERLVGAIQSTGADFVSGLARLVDDKGEYISDIQSIPFDAATRLRMPLRHETMLVPVELYNQVGPYSDEYRVIADFAFTLRLMECGYIHYELPVNLMSFRNTGVSSRDMALLTADRKKLLSGIFPELHPSDVELLAEHGKLSPINIDSLIFKYSNISKLKEALHAFVTHQIRRGNKRWVEHGPLVRGADGDHASEGETFGPVASRIGVATLCSMDHGGAGVGTQRRVEALRHIGVDARILCLVAKTSFPYVRRISPLDKRSQGLDQTGVWDMVRAVSINPIRKLPGFKARELFSTPESVLSSVEVHEATKWADVVHLHWVVGMIDLRNVPVEWSNRPVVWTLADMNAFTGGCHYSEGCDGYMQDCRQCPLLGDNVGISQATWKMKGDAYEKLSNLSIVCPTRWIEDKVRRSSLLGHRPIHYIPNAFPVDRFVMHNKYLARLKLGLPLDKKIMLFAADSLTNPRKGAELLKAALRIFARSHSVKDCLIVVFGSSDVNLPIAVRSMGFVNDDSLLSFIYSSADVFLSTTLEDSGPMTVGESLCCGTPVVSFNVGYAPDIVEHLVTGYIATVNDAAGFSAGIEWAFTTGPTDALERSIKCRMAGAQFHDPKVAASRHLSLYHSVLN